MFELGPFHIQQVLGRGGMGVVFGGVHRREKVPVALKVLTSSAALGASGTLLFEREVQALARLNHPHIAAVLDVGSVDDLVAVHAQGMLPPGSPWLAMELARGGPMLLPEGRQAWTTLYPILRDLLRALAHAHALEVVHRDLKPANVLVDYSLSPPRVTLVDFGIALATDDGAHDERGMVLGTPNYMAPEQALNHPRDQGPWTDLYAVGCIAWALLTGRPPFAHHGEPASLMAAQVHAELPPFRPRFPVPDAIESWLVRLLEKRPRDRFRWAADAAYALDTLAPTESLPESGLLRSSVAPIGADTGPLADAFTPSFDDAPTLRTGRFEAASSTRSPGPPRLRPVAELKGPPIPRHIGHEDAAPLARTLLGAGLGLYGRRVLPVVGRDEERALLWSCLREAAQRGRPTTVVLHGAPGVGKSRLVRWLMARAHEKGAATCISVSHSRQRGPLDGLGPAFARHFGCTGLSIRDTVERLSQAYEDLGCTDVSTYFDVMGLTSFIHEELTAEPSLNLLRAPRERFLALRRYVQKLASTRTVVLWLDDVQWGGDAVRFARALLEEPTEEALPILIAATCTSAPAQVRSETLRWLFEASSARVVAVEPLSRAVQSELVRSLLRLDPALVSKVLERTEGNPLFAVQLVGQWVEQEMLEPGEHGFVLAAEHASALPDDIHDLWCRRVAQALRTVRADLLEAARTALEVGAVLGRELDEHEWDQACRSAGVDDPDQARQMLLRAGLVCAAPQGWAFLHGMLHESVLRVTQERGRLATLHRVCAEVLDRYASPTPPQLRRRAVHLAKAGELELAAAILLRVALEQRAASDYPAALETLALRGEVLDRSALHRESVERMEQTWMEAWVRGQRGERAQATVLVDAALPVARARGYEGMIGELLVLRGGQAYQSGEVDACVEACIEALELLEAHGRVDGMTRCYRMLANVCIGLGDTPTARDYVHRTMDLLEHLPTERVHADTLHLLAVTHLHDGDLERARTVAEEGMSVARALNSRLSLANAYNLLGEIARKRGALDEARGHYQENADLLDALGHRNAHIAALNLAYVELEAGRYEQALVAYAQLEVHVRKAGWSLLLPAVLAGRAACFAGTHRWPECGRALDALDEYLDGIDMIDHDVVTAAEIGVRAAHDVGDKALAVRFQRVASHWRVEG